MVKLLKLSQKLIQRMHLRRKWEKVKDSEYLAWLRNQPCYFCGFSSGLNAVDHVGDGWGTKKNNDHMCLPVCDRSMNIKAPNCHHEKRHFHKLEDIVILREAATGYYSKYIEEQKFKDLSFEV